MHTSNPKCSTQSNRKFLAGLCLAVTVILVLYLAFSLLSFDPADPSWSQTARHQPVHNLGGLLGSWLADTLLFVFGVIAYCLPLMLFLQGLAVYRWYLAHQSIDFFAIAFRLLGTATFLFSSCGLAAFNIDDIYYFASGGLIGSLLNDTLNLWLNAINSTLLLLFFWGAGITLFTGWSWLKVAEKVGEIAISTATSLITRFKKKNTSNQFKQTDIKQQQALYEQYSDYEYDPLFAKPSLPEQQIVESSKVRFAVPEKGSDLSENHHAEGTDIRYKDRMDDLKSTYERYQHKATPGDESIKSSSSTSHENPLFSNIRTPNIELNNDSLFDRLPDRKLIDYSSQEGSNDLLFNELSNGEPVTKISEPDELFSHLSIIKSPYSDESNNKDPKYNLESEHSKDERLVEKLKQESLLHPFLMRNERIIPATSVTPLPTLDLLMTPPKSEEPVDLDELERLARLIEVRLADYRVKARVADILPGPVITRFELELAPGVKVARISNLSRDLARSLSAAAVRVVEVIPGKPYVGLELPNRFRQTVYLREVFDCDAFSKEDSPLAIVLGKDIEGYPVVADLAKMPHLLVAGTTGSGKSVGVNAMILSILYKAKPEDVKFIMIDPKMLELSVYAGIPHLLTEVVTDMKDATNALRWCVNEMERRYKLMSTLGVRNIAGYNERILLAQSMHRPIPDPFWKPSESFESSAPHLEKLPYIVVMVDEFADLIMSAGKKVEELIARLAQKARAAGIHLVLATQRPSVDVITGLIKANIPTRIAFTVSSKIDSRTILDQGGAESLLGMGDMLYLPPNSSVPIRVHGAFVRDQEVHAVVQDWKTRGEPVYIDSVVTTEESDSNAGFNDENELDPLFDQVVAFVTEKRRASISGVQRQFRIGYNRAARIVEQLEMHGIVSAPGHNGNREVLTRGGFD